MNGFSLDEKRTLRGIRKKTMLDLSNSRKCSRVQYENQIEDSNAVERATNKKKVDATRNDLLLSHYAVLGSSFSSSGFVVASLVAANC